MIDPYVAPDGPPHPDAAREPEPDPHPPEATQAPEAPEAPQAAPGPAPTSEASPEAARPPASSPEPDAGSEVPGPTLPSVTERITAFLDGRGLGPAVLVPMGVAGGGVAVLCLLVGHPGLGGVFGLLAIALSALGLAPRQDREPPVDPLARAGAMLLDLGLLGGIVARAAAVGSGLTLVLGLVDLVLCAWLPYLKAWAPSGLIPPHAGFWRRAERLTIVMLGAVTGRLAYALAMVALVGVLDAVFRLERLRTGPGRRWHPKFLEPLVADDGTLEPVVRYGSLLLAILLLAVLPQQAGWRF